MKTRNLTINEVRNLGLDPFTDNIRTAKVDDIFRANGFEIATLYNLRLEEERYYID